MLGMFTKSWIERRPDKKRRVRLQRQEKVISYDDHDDSG